MARRSAIHAQVIVVSDRSRPAKRAFRRSPLRYHFKLFSVQPESGSGLSLVGFLALQIEGKVGAMGIMPRQLRIDYPGASHHVMSRGDRREDIYPDDVVEGCPENNARIEPMNRVMG